MPHFKMISPEFVRTYHYLNVMFQVKLAAQVFQPDYEDKLAQL